MPEFKIVDHDRRGNNLSPMTQALLDGNTLLVPHGKSATASYPTLRRRGYKLHTHQTPDGTVVWAERITDGR